MPQISQGKFNRFRRTTAGFTTGELDGYWASQSLARSPATVGLISGSCSSARVFAPRFFQAPPRGECCSPLRFAMTSLPSSCQRDFHPQAVEHARHTNERAACAALFIRSNGQLTAESGLCAFVPAGQVFFLLGGQAVDFDA